MNLSLELAKSCIFMLIGAFLCDHFMPEKKQDQPPIITQKQESKCMVTLKKEIKPDGSIDEVAQFLADSSQEQKVATQPEIKAHKYGLGLYNDKTMFVEARIGSMPLLLIGESNIKGEARIGLKIEF